MCLGGKKEKKPFCKRLRESMITLMLTFCMVLYLVATLIYGLIVRKDYLSEPARLEIGMSSFKVLFYIMWAVYILVAVFLIYKLLSKRQVCGKENFCFYLFSAVFLAMGFWVNGWSAKAMLVITDDFSRGCSGLFADSLTRAYTLADLPQEDQEEGQVAIFKKLNFIALRANSTLCSSACPCTLPVEEIPDDFVFNMDNYLPFLDVENDKKGKGDSGDSDRLL